MRTRCRVTRGSSCLLAAPAAALTRPVDLPHYTMAPVIKMMDFPCIAVMRDQGAAQASHGLDRAGPVRPGRLAFHLAAGSRRADVSCPTGRCAAHAPSEAPAKAVEEGPAAARTLIADAPRKCMAPERGVPENTGRKQEAAVMERAEPCSARRCRASLIANNNEFAMAGNFACNGNGVRRQSPANNNEYQCKNNGRYANRS
jgi:hypothetical protein